MSSPSSKWKRQDAARRTTTGTCASYALCVTVQVEQRHRARGMIDSVSAYTL
ncbi:MAG: hypothetical protein M3381_08085 [Actinomycetota bacterium]|nr:hypothetical protein [Actinomycetota bacterium]